MSLLFLSSLLFSKHFLILLLLEFISQVLHILHLLSSLLFLFLQSLEYLLSFSLSNCLLLLDVRLSLVLQLCIFSDHLVFKSLDLLQSVKIGLLLHKRHHHVSLRLILLGLRQLLHLEILVDHLLDHRLNIGLLLLILSYRLLSQSLSLNHLVLEILISNELTFLC